MEGRCKYHPSHNQLKGVCPFCLRERLSRVKGSSSAPSTMISSASYESSSGASPTTRMRKRRKVKRTKSSLPASSGQTQLRKSRSMASVLGIISSTKSMREGGEDGRGKGRKEVSGKLGFWYKLLGIEKKKKKKKMVVKKKIDDEVVSGNKEEIQ